MRECLYTPPLACLFIFPLTLPSRSYPSNHAPSPLIHAHIHLTTPPDRLTTPTLHPRCTDTQRRRQPSVRQGESSARRFRGQPRSRRHGQTTTTSRRHLGCGYFAKRRRFMGLASGQLTVGNTPHEHRPTYSQFYTYLYVYIYII